MQRRDGAKEKFQPRPEACLGPAVALRGGMGLRLHHRDLGGTGRPPLVILHGMLGSSRNWQTAGRDLADRYHVLALDARNHGASPHAEPMAYPAMVDDVLGWLEERGLPQVTLLGHSMGGKTAMLLACRQPSRVERLIIVDIAPKDYSWPAHRAEYAAMNGLSLAALRSRTEAERQLASGVNDWAKRKFLATNLESDAAGRWRWVINLPVLTAALPELERNPLGPDEIFMGPSLFITGGKSPYVTAADEAAIHRHFPDARMVVLPESGHNPHIEMRVNFVRQVFSAGWGLPGS
jgi:pimeloyl-ACP methyl ester carboxylesterase